MTRFWTILLAVAIVGLVAALGLWRVQNRVGQAVVPALAERPRGGDFFCAVSLPMTADSGFYDCPLVRVSLLLRVLPFVALSLVLRPEYLLNPDADVITLCGGTLFSGALAVAIASAVRAKVVGEDEATFDRLARESLQ